MPFYEVTAPFAIQMSHDWNRPGFQSSNTMEMPQIVNENEIDCLGLHLKTLRIEPRASGGLVLSLSATFDSKDAVIDYLQGFEIALTSFLGRDPANGYYGTPAAAVNFFGTEIVDTEGPGGISIKLGLTGTDREVVTRKDLEAFQNNPIVQLFSSGLRASSADTKFLSWFAIVEEFLERSLPLNHDFKTLFGEDEQMVIQAWSANLGEKGNRIKGDLGGLARRTELSRAAKLSQILHNLGINEVCRHKQHIKGAEKPIPVTPELCQALITDRNKLFHSGRTLDNSRIYTVLYPLICELVKQSESLVKMREQS